MSDARGLSTEPLQDCLRTLHARAQLVVHITEPGYEEELFDCLKNEHFRLRDYVVISANTESLQRFQDFAQNARLGLFVNSSHEESSVDALEHLGVDFIAVAHSGLENSHLECAKHWGRPVIVLDVDSERDKSKLCCHECVAGVIAKFPPVSDELPGFGRTA